MPLLLPLLSRYWKPLAILGVAAILGGYVWLLRHELATCELHVAMFKAVQARNEEAIKAQNRAVRKLWAEGKILREKSQSAGVIAQKQVSQAVAAISRPVDLTGKTCDADVTQVWRLVRGLK